MILSLVFAATCWLAWTVRLWMPPLVQWQLMPAALAGLTVRPVDPLLVLLLLCLTCAASVAALVLLIRRWWAFIPCLITIAAALATFAPTGLWWSGEVYYQAHRDELSALAAFIQSPEFQKDPGARSRVGVQLPASLAALSADGKVAYTSWDGSPFLPVWYGMPDNAGGLLYSTVDPTDQDMHGLICTHPKKLAESWWSCGMP